MGTECKNAECSDGRAGGQGRWVHLPQRHHGCGCVVSPCPSQASLPRAGHRASDQGAASLQKRRDLYPPLLPQASLPSSLPPWAPTHVLQNGSWFLTLFAFRIGITGNIKCMNSWDHNWVHHAGVCAGLSLLWSLGCHLSVHTAKKRRPSTGS